MCPQVSFKITLCWKYFHHIGYLDMVFHLCVLRCLKRLLFSENTWTHWLHWYGFSPLCVLRWVLRSLCFDHDLSHWLQWYVFSPVCVLKWNLRILCVGYVLLQWLHWYGFSHVCVLIKMIFKMTLGWKYFIRLATSQWSQQLHWYGFF